MPPENSTLQDTLINQLLQEQLPVTVFLVNGLKLQGKITAFDRFTMLLSRNTAELLVYKQVIATVVPDDSLEY
jgi:host factor-I protein